MPAAESQYRRDELSAASADHPHGFALLLAGSLIYRDYTFSTGLRDCPTMMSERAKEAIDRLIEIAENSKGNRDG